MGHKFKVREWIYSYNKEFSRSYSLFVSAFVTKLYNLNAFFLRWDHNQLLFLRLCLQQFVPPLTLSPLFFLRPRQRQMIRNWWHTNSEIIAILRWNLMVLKLNIFNAKKLYAFYQQHQQISSVFFLKTMASI